MGLNAFTYTVVFFFRVHLAKALCEITCGVISLIITVTKVHGMVIESIPTALKSAISAGISVFLAYVGIKNAGFLEILQTITYLHCSR